MTGTSFPYTPTPISAPADPLDNESATASVSRRATLGGLAGLALPAFAAGAPSLEFDKTYTSRGRSLSQLRSMFGVNVVTSTANGPYGQRETVLRALKDVGAAWIRSRIHTGNKGQVTFLNQLAANGIKTNGLIDVPGKRDTPEALVALVASSMPGAMMSLEGPNEWNLQGGSNWASELVSHQTRLWNAAKANPATRNLPVVGPALGMRKGYAEFGNRSAIMDWGNIHLYTGGYVPGYRTDDVLREQRTVSGSKPIIVTETGWHNASDWRGPHYYTPEDIAGLYAPRLWLEYFIRDVPKMAIYELCDNPAGRNLREHHFGLLRGDMSRKPAFQAFANMNTILQRTARYSGRAGASLSFAFRSGPSDLRSALLSGNNGVFLLFLWRANASIYDPVSRRRLTPSPSTATLAWGANRRVTRYTPGRSASSTHSEVTATSSVSLDADLQVLEIRPA